MAGWTSPRTWVTSEIVTAAEMNAHVRDNFNAINGFVQKTADESVTSSTVLQNDDHLLYTIGAAGTYVVDCYLIGTSAANAAGDLAVAFTFPTASATYYTGFGPDIGLASGHVQTGEWIAANTGITSGSLITAYGLSTSQLGIWLHVVFTFTATGTLRFQWAQNVSSGSASTLKAGSHMTVKQVA